MESTTLILRLALFNASKFTRGKKKARESIEVCDLAYYAERVRQQDDREYELLFRYVDHADLARKISDMVVDMHRTADDRNCFLEFSLREKDSGRYWSDSTEQFID